MFGGGIRHDGHGVPQFAVGGVTVVNTILANSPSSDCSGNIPLTSLGHNLSGEDSCGLADPTDLPLTDPLLRPLQDNGGPTKTHALQPSSPAIDAGDDGAAPATDQRGVSRPQGVASDIGAFELQPPSCTAEVDLIFADGIATWTLVVEATQPSAWSVSVTLLGNDIPLWSIDLPPLPPTNINFSFSVPPIGIIEVQSTLAVEGGECAASDAVDTGP